MKGMNWYLPGTPKIGDSQPNNFRGEIRGIAVGAQETLIGKVALKIFNPAFEKGSLFLCGIKICLKL